MKRKLLSMLLAVAMIAAMLPAGLVLAEDVQIASAAVFDPDQNIFVGANTVVSSGEGMPAEAKVENMGPAGRINGGKAFTGTVTVNVPKDGFYYAYVNTRFRSDMDSGRKINLSVTQNGNTVPYNATFGVGNIKDEADNWKYNLVFPLFKCDEPIFLTKGTAELNIIGAIYSGFSYALLTMQGDLMQEIDSHQTEQDAQYGCITENNLYTATLSSYYDTSAPGIPALTGAANDGGAVLKPTSTDSDIAFYGVYKDDGAFLMYGQVNADGELYVPIAGTEQVSLKVRAYDKSGNRSDYSEAVSVTPRGDILAPTVEKVEIEPVDLYGAALLKVTASDNSGSVCQYQFDILNNKGNSVLSKSISLVAQAAEPVSFLLKNLPFDTTFDIQVAVSDANDNTSDPQTVSVTTKGGKVPSNVCRPQIFVNANTTGAAPQETAKKPELFTTMLLQPNLTRIEDAGKYTIISDLFLKTDNIITENPSSATPQYCLDSGTFTKAFEGNFVIPESFYGNEEGDTYQIISSYFRIPGGTIEKGFSDDRRTQFYVIDGKAITEDGLELYNGERGHWKNPVTNSYILGEYIPDQGTTVVRDDGKHYQTDLNQVYPFNVMGPNSGMLWDSTPVFKLTPGVHKIEVYTIGGYNFFNNIFLTQEIGYDMSQLFGVGLETRRNTWSSSDQGVYIKNGVKEAFEDFEAPTFDGSAEIDVTDKGVSATLSWPAATNSGRGYTDNQPSVYEVSYGKGKTLDPSAVTTRYLDGDTSLSIEGLDPATEYTVKVTAYDYTGAHSDTITQTFTTKDVDATAPYVVVSPSAYVLAEGETANWSKDAATVTITGMDDGSGVKSMTVNGATVNPSSSAIKEPYYKLKQASFIQGTSVLTMNVNVKGGIFQAGYYALQYDKDKVEIQTRTLVEDPETGGFTPEYNAASNDSEMAQIIGTKTGFNYLLNKPSGINLGGANIDVNEGKIFFSWAHTGKVDAIDAEQTVASLYFKLKQGVTIDDLTADTFTVMNVADYEAMRPATSTPYGSEIATGGNLEDLYTEAPQGGVPLENVLTMAFEFGNVSIGAKTEYKFTSAAPINAKTDFAVVVTDNEGNKYEKTWTAYIDAQAPTISDLTLTPAAGQITAAVTAADTGGSGVKNYTYTLKKGTTPVGEPIVKNSSEAAVFTELDDETEYEVTVVVSDNAGNTATKTATTTTLPDDIAPTWPASSAITAESSYNYTTDQWAVTISWPAATDNKAVAGYNVYLGNSTTPLNIGLITGTSYTATGLAVSTEYTFKVVAVDGAGNQSDPLTLTDTTGAKPVASMEVSVGLVHHVKLGTKDAMQMEVTIAANEKSSEIALGSDMVTTQPILDGAGSITAEIKKNLADDEYVDSFVLTGTMNPGTYKITITGAGYMTYEKTITIADQETETVTVTNAIGGGFAAGDILGTDKQIDLNDLSAIAGNFNAAEKYTSPEMVQFDLNRDGFIDITDIVYVIRNFSSRAQ